MKKEELDYWKIFMERPMPNPHEECKWVKFSERKPSLNQWVIVWRKELREPFQMTWGGFSQIKELLIGDLNLLTHWMPLPEPPSDQNELDKR